jgi:HD-like signal output (HDOD) protein
MIDLDKLLIQANELAPLPATAVSLAEMVARPNCHLADVAELIRYDQTLTLKVLKAANSAASAPEERIGDVRDAVTRIGTAQVLGLVVASSARSLLRRRILAYGLEEGALWRHSVAAAVAVEAMHRVPGLKPPPETFTAALLHDVGKLVMGRFLTPTVAGVIGRAKEADHLAQSDAEYAILQANHGEVGGVIAQHWLLPPGIVAGITFHHDPDKGGDPICDYCHLADGVAKSIEAGLDNIRHDIVIRPEIAERLGLDEAKIQELCSESSACYEQVKRRYNAV